MNRKPFPRDLDVGAASPIGDRAEFVAAFLAIRQAAPTRVLIYVGTDGREHFFQEYGVPTAYSIPVSPGWCPRARAA